MTLAIWYFTEFGIFNINIQKDDPHYDELTYEEGDPLTFRLKDTKTMEKIIEILKERIQNGDEFGLVIIMDYDDKKEKEYRRVFIIGKEDGMRKVELRLTTFYLNDAKIFVDDTLGKHLRSRTHSIIKTAKIPEDKIMIFFEEFIKALKNPVSYDFSVVEKLMKEHGVDYSEKAEEYY